MTYKWKSLWYAEYYTIEGRHMKTAKFIMPKGCTREDVLAKLEYFKAGRERTYTVEGVCSMTKRKLKL